MDQQPTSIDQGDQLNRSSRSADADQLCHDDIVGADGEFKIMLNILTKEDEKSNVVVLAIVGMGGIGKTTLARKLYDDRRTRSAFDTTLWIYVSKDFTDTVLLSSIISVAGGNPRGLQTRAELEIMLARIIEGKRFLLVLDDIWSVRIYEDLLETPLGSGTRGSRILVTTRDKNVAAQMKAAYVHEVEKLSTEDGWTLVCKKASLKEESDIHALEEVGMQIVERCNGLPMAIKTIGGVLRTKGTLPHEWQSVNANPGWSFKDLPEGTQGVMGAIYLSYDNLPSHLKQCFLYCSLFPADFVIKQHFVTQLWISEGLVDSRTDCNPEEIAKEYYNELVSRNLLQPEPGSHDTTQCIMHDRVRSFMQFLTKDEILTSDLKCMINPAAGLRRLSIVNKGLTAIPRDIVRLTRLRTLLLFKNPLSSHGLDEIFRKLKYLRVLDLGATSIEHIPRSLGKLLHLRHLSLSLTRIKELPESIEHLSNLRFLGLQSCIGLHSLPKGIQKLQNLRVLDLRGTALNLVPQRIGKLVHLSLVHGFVVNNKIACQNDRNGWPLEELKSLDKLTSLQILKIERALDGSEASEAVLESKAYLRELELCCSSENRQVEVLDGDAMRVKKIFDELTPPPCLQSLKIVGYFGNLYPDWMSVSNLPNLQRLHLMHCMFCQHLPSLGQLPQLRFLSIIGSSALHAIYQRTASELPAFPKLEELHIKDMYNLELWSGFKDGDLPCLRKFRLDNCPRLRSLPDGLQYSTLLTSMHILHADSIEVVENLVVKELVLQSNPWLARISKLPLLEVLTIISCPVLHNIEEVSSLCHLHMVDRQLKELPEWLGQHAPRLQTFDIVGTAELLQRSLLDGEDWPVIASIAHVYASLPDISVSPSFIV